MAFLDKVTLKIFAGKGGDGVVRWRREKSIDSGGPWGGNGGNGGDVYIQGVRNLHALNHYRHIHEFKAPSGAPGATQLKHGKRGEDLVLTFPLGTKIYNVDLEITYELLNEGEQILILHGGRGGLGNNEFKNSVRRAPEIATPGKRGEFAKFQIELQLIADVGLIGFPNAGKSSLLNALTNATSKVASYEFTTLEPHLGDYFGHVIADIPGLIEGASEGKGLGHNFLRHIERTRILAHLVSAESEDVAAAYTTIRNELGAFNAELLNKEEIVILSKIDAVSDTKALEKKIKELEKVSKKKVVALSLFDDASIKQFTVSLNEELNPNKIKKEVVKEAVQKIVAKTAPKKVAKKVVVKKVIKKKPLEKVVAKGVKKKTVKK